MTEHDQTRGEALVVDAVTVRKETRADTFAMRITGTYPANEAARWEHILHPARLFNMLERDASREAPLLRPQD